MDYVVKFILVIVPSYLIGAIPSSYIIGKLVRGIDLREHGSGNLGAANTFRVLGVRAALPVLLFDIGKGLVAVRYFSGFGGESVVFMLLAAFAVVLGHSYSLFVGFSGGKGVGTTAGAFFAMAPYAVAASFAVWLIILFATRIVSVASIAGAVFLPIAVIISNRIFNNEVHNAVLLLAVAVALLVVYKHRSNIQRLREGSEKRIF
jgi:glycerol-3-phosphate acyltransferase PlsY